MQNESELSSQSISLPTPEEEKEKIFAEMLASAGDTTPNEVWAWFISVPD